MSKKPLVKFFGICVLVVLGSMSILATGGGGGDGSDSVGGPPDRLFGVIAFTQGWIGVIDPNSRNVVTPLLVGELGSVGGGQFDVAITPDGLTTLISNFGDSTIHFIDTTTPSSPKVTGDVDIGFFAEDIAITPDGRFALVTDGGFSEHIATVDIATQTLVDIFPEFPIPPDLADAPAASHTPSFQTDGLAMDEPSAPAATPYSNAVAVTPDGQTVLTVDYFQGMVHVFTMDYASGHLTHVDSIDVSLGLLLRPVNVAISPNGRTAIVASVSDDVTYNLGFPVLDINGPGDVTLNSIVASYQLLRGAQSVAFSPDGTQAYVHCTQVIPDDWVYVPPDNFGPPLVAVVLNVDPSTGLVMNSGVAWPTDTFGTSQLFGVETIAMAPGGRYLFVSNPTLSGGLPRIDVLDTQTGAVTPIPFSDTEVLDWSTVDPDDYLVTIPVGIAFFTEGWY